MKVCFCCENIYSIMISYLLTKTRYKRDSVTIILSDRLQNSKEIYLNIKSLHLFENVYLINEKNLTKAYKDKQNIIDQLKDLNFDEYDTMHIFAFSSMYTMAIYENYKGKLILTEEGLGTYIAESRYWFYRLHRIDEIWVFEKNMYMGNKYKFKVREINIDEEMSDIKSLKIFCKELNLIFGYTYEKIFSDEKIYLDEYFSFSHKGMNLEEEIFLNNILQILNHYDFSIKIHPFRFNRDYISKFDVKMFEAKVIIPMELYILNKIVQKGSQITIDFMSIHSTASLCSKFLFKKYLKGKIILLQNLMGFDNEEINEFIKKFKNTHSNEVIEINSFQELDKVLSKLYRYDMINKHNIEIGKLDLKEWITICQVICMELNQKEFDLNFLRIRLFYLKQILKNKKQINYMIWGASKGGKIAKFIIEELDKKSHLIGYIDSYKSGKFDNKDIISPNNIKNLNPDYIVIATSPGRDVAEKQLKNMGYRSNEDYMYVLE